MSCRLIIVDDEKEISNGFARFFPWDKLGFSVVGQFSRAKDALRFLKHNDVEVVVSDVIMPEMNGIEMAKEIRNMKKEKPVKIIFFSAYDEFVYAQKALEYGVSKYILKTTSYDELIEIFRLVKREFVEAAHIRYQEPHGSEDQVLIRIKDYIERHLEDVTLSDLAKEVYMSPAYISRYFKSKTKKNFHIYLNEQRMEKAAVLLKDRNYRICDISSFVGYKNPFNFTRAFKKFYGITPSEYRGAQLKHAIPKKGLSDE